MAEEKEGNFEKRLSVENDCPQGCRAAISVLGRLETEITVLERQVEAEQPQISKNGLTIQVTTNANHASANNHGYVGSTFNMPGGDLHVYHHHHYHYGQDWDEKVEAPPLFEEGRNADLEQAVVFHLQGNVLDAIDRYNLVLNTDPNNVTALVV